MKSPKRADDRKSSRRSSVRRETILVRLRRWWSGAPAPRLANAKQSGARRAAPAPVVATASPLTAALRADLVELADRLSRGTETGGAHLAGRLRAVLAHDGVDLHRVIIAQVHEADATELESQVVALRAASAAWASARAPYARERARELGMQADRMQGDWLTIKRLLDARWGAAERLEDAV